MSPSEITTILVALGCPVPKGVIIAADAAQVLVSGAAAIDDAQTAEDISSVVCPAATAVQALAQLAHEAGWIDADQAAELTIITDVVLIFASWGSNVFAWISLCCTIFSTGAAAQATANALAQARVDALYTGLINSNLLGVTKASLDLSAGNVGIFGYLTELATTSPALFAQCIVQNPKLAGLRQLLPGLNFLPMQNTVITSETAVKGILGQGAQGAASIAVENLAIAGAVEIGAATVANPNLFQTGTPTVTLQNQVISDVSPLDAFKYIFYNVFYPSFRNFSTMEIALKAAGRATFLDHALLAAVDIGQDYKITGARDILNRFKKNRVTPSDLGDSGLLQTLPESQVESAVSGAFNLTTEDMPKDIVLQADKIGRPDVIFQNSNARTLVENFYDISDVMQTSRLSSVTLTDYISALDIADLVKTDPYYKKFQTQVPEIAQIGDSLPSQAEFMAKAQNLMGIVQARKVNYGALMNIAYFLGQNSVSKIKRVGPLVVNGPSTYAVK